LASAGGDRRLCRWLDNLIMRILDVLLAFPSLLLAIAIVSVLGPKA
jgi:peptide/nickel transport system permease protein